MKNVVIHSKKNCPYCVKTKLFFDSRDIKYEEVQHNNERKRLKFYDELSEKESKSIKTMPQIYVDGEYIGGYSQLMSKLGRLLTGSLSMLDSSITYKPFRYPWAVEIGKSHERIHWIEDEIELTDDVSDWKIPNKLTYSEKNFITNVLRLFTQSDVQVGANYYDQFLPRIQANEVRNMLGSFAAREAIHQRAYALLNETLGLPDSEYHTFLEYTEMSEKIEYMAEGNPNTHSGLGLCMAKSVFNEGLMLFASFAALMNFQRHGKMKGMCKVVEWSIRDESMHVEGISKMFRVWCAEKPRIVTDAFKKAIYDMARQTVKLEDKFIELLYKDTEIEGLTMEDMKMFIRYVADRRLIQLGLKPEFGVKENPLPWLEELIVGTDHSNFFEARVTEYEVGGATGDFLYDFVE